MSKSSARGRSGAPPALASFLERAHKNPDAEVDEEDRVHVDGRILNPHVSHGKCGDACSGPGRPGYYVLDESTLSEGTVEFVCTADECDWVRTVPASVYQHARLKKGQDLPPLQHDGGGAP